MNLSHAIVAISAMGLATGSLAQGVIHMQGSLVEPGCAFTTAAGASVQLGHCPTPVQHNALHVQNAAGVPAALTIEQSAEGHYLLVDSNGQLIRSGDYVVTLNTP